MIDDELIAACRLAKVDALAGGERLRRVCHAGRLAAALPRSKGGRNSSSLLDELRKAVGISRQRLYAWIDAGRVPDDVRNTYIETREMAGKEPTIDGLLKAFEPKGDDERACMVSLGTLSEEQRRRFNEKLDTLTASTAFRTTSRGETLVAVVDRVFEEVVFRKASSYV